ncbi:MAG: hypothetical protein QM520_06290, partial [Gammaproteobacteria bacterium]|nr:hypothetical protein [Gammaproteobacteria bacterium]
IKTVAQPVALSNYCVMQYSPANDHPSKFRWLRAAKPCTLTAHQGCATVLNTQTLVFRLCKN